MPKVTFLPDNYVVEIDEGATILEAAENFDIPLKHDCGGSGNCGTCHVIVEEGGENLKPMSPEEEDTLDSSGEVTNESRLACQCRVRDDIIVTIPESSRED